MESNEERSLSNERSVEHGSLDKKRSLLSLARQIQNGDSYGVFNQVRKNSEFSFESYSPQRVEKLLTNKTKQKKNDRFIAQAVQKLAGHLSPTEMIKKLSAKRLLQEEKQAL